jgi:bacterioferritin-associated ferredoxin
VALVCSCNAVGERRVRRAVDDGATTVAEVAAACGAGNSCYGCHPTIEEILEQSVATPAVRRLLAS